jgi:hypothetical protein
MPVAVVHVKRVAACEYGSGRCFIHTALLHAQLQLPEMIQSALAKL